MAILSEDAGTSGCPQEQILSFICLPAPWEQMILQTSAPERADLKTLHACLGLSKLKKQCKPTSLDILHPFLEKERVQL